MTNMPSERFADVSQASLTARVGSGIHFALAGVGLTLRRPDLRLLALLCVIINLVIYGGLAALGFWLIDGVGPDPSAYEGWLETAMEWARGALQVALLITWLLVSIWLAIFLGGLLCSPFFDLLSERTEQHLVGRHVGPPFSLAATVRSALLEMAVQLKLLFVYLPIALGILLVNLIPVVGQVLSSTLAWVWTAQWVTMTFAGPATARHGLTASQRMQLLFGNKALSTGFGAIGGIPFLSFFLLPLLSPALIVGMTRMYLALAAHDRVPSKLSEAEKRSLRGELPVAHALPAR